MPPGIIDIFDSKYRDSTNGLQVRVVGLFCTSMGQENRAADPVQCKVSYRYLEGYKGILILPYDDFVARFAKIL